MKVDGKALKIPLLIARVLLFLPVYAQATEYLELKRLSLIDDTGATVREVKRLLIRDDQIVVIDGQGSAPVPEPGALANIERAVGAGEFVGPGQRQGKTTARGG